jgi:hypothetical protein
MALKKAGISWIKVARGFKQIRQRMPRKFDCDDARRASGIATYDDCMEDIIIIRKKKKKTSFKRMG